MLRDYQIKGLDLISEMFRSGFKKVLLHLDTGAGKTVMFSEAITRTVAREYNAIMAVHGRDLVNQASKRLFREFVPHGVYMAGHPLYRPWEKIQLCSIDTLRSRNVYPKADLVVIDEAHMATTPAWMRFSEQYPDAYFISVTATPYMKKSIRHVAETVVRPIDFMELVEKKYLVDARYIVPTKIDLSGIKIQAGDYHKGQLEKRINTGKLVGDIVSTWIKFAGNRPSVCFAVSVAHSLEIVSQFEKAGIRAVHVEASTKDADRESAIKGLGNGSIKVISNVGILCTGVDIPYLGCIIMARPTKSYPLYIQQLGRGTRPFDGKSDFLVLDHAGNVLRHGFISDQPNASLDGIGKRVLGFRKTKVCPKCFLAFQSYHCPTCGKIEAPQGQVIPETMEGELSEICDVERYLPILKRMAEERGYKRNWVWYKLRDRFGEEVADKHFKAFGVQRKIDTSWKLER